MTHMLDIFRMESSGVLWLGSAASLEGAKARLQELAVRSPGEYLVLDLETGNKHVIQVGGMEESAGSRSTEVGNQ